MLDTPISILVLLVASKSYHCGCVDVAQAARTGDAATAAMLGVSLQHWSALKPFDEALAAGVLTQLGGLL